MYWVEDTKSRIRVYDCFLHTMVIDGEIAVFFCNESYPFTIRTGSYQTRLDGIRRAVFRTLINNILTLREHLPIGQLTFGGDSCYQVQHESGLSITRIAL